MARASTSVLLECFAQTSWPGLARPSTLAAVDRHARACPAIHVFAVARPKTWMPGTSPGMTAERQYANATHHPASAIQHSLMAGHSRPKDGVLSHAYVPASQITDSHFKQPRPNSQSNSHASSPVLFGEAPGRPVFPLSPLKDEGDGAPRGATIVLDVPAFPLGNTGRRSARHPDRLAHVRVYLRRLPSCAGPRFSWPPVTHGTASVSQLLAGGSYWPPGGAPAPPGCVLARHARGRRIRSHPA